jgi:hypothetical protein
MLWWPAQRRFPVLRVAGAGLLGAAVVGAGFGASVALRTESAQHHPIVQRFGDTVPVTVRPGETPRSVGNGRLMFAAGLLRIADHETGGRVMVFAPVLGFADLSAGQPVRFRARISRPVRRDLSVAVLTATGPPAFGEASGVQRAARSLRDRFAAAREHREAHRRWNALDADARAPHALLVGFALLFGSLAKSAQLPMSPWLHRAMEGPAASSAIFYGALSVHLGPFLLLRTSKLWFDEPVVLWSMGAIGALTAMWASAVGRTRPDAKTALAYSTMTQIGVMYVELALGMHKLVAFHMFAHAGLRTWQFLRSSSLIQDFQDNPVFAASIGLRRRLFVERILPLRLQRWLYVAAVRLFWIDSIQWHFVARPFLALFSGLVALEDWALGRKGREEASR